MESVNIYDAKTRFSQLVSQAAAGQDVVDPFYQLLVAQALARLLKLLSL